MSERITLADIQRLREWAKQQETAPRPPVMRYIDGKWEKA